jgi:hypothetical protein
MMLLCLFLGLHCHIESGTITIRERGIATVHYKKPFTKTPACTVSSGSVGKQSEKMFQIHLTGQLGTVVAWKCEKK